MQFSTAAVPFCAPTWCTGVSVFLHPRQYFLFSFFFFDSSHPDGYEVIPTVVSIRGSLMISDIEHFFMCSFTIFMSPLEKYLSKSFACLLIGSSLFV